MHPSTPMPLSPPDSTSADEATFDHPCIVELFGHQRFAGRVRQAAFPPGFLRLDVPATGDQPAVTQIVSPNAVYRLTPVAEDVATAVAARCRPAPVHRWELPAPPPADARPDDDADLVAEYEGDVWGGDDLDGEDDDEPDEPLGSATRRPVVAADGGGS
jgi:hypothetical protein